MSPSSFDSGGPAARGGPTQPDVPGPRRARPGALLAWHGRSRVRVAPQCHPDAGPPHASIDRVISAAGVSEPCTVLANHLSYHDGTCQAPPAPGSPQAPPPRARLPGPSYAVTGRLLTTTSSEGCHSATARAVAGNLMLSKSARLGRGLAATIASGQNIDETKPSRFLIDRASRWLQHRIHPNRVTISYMNR